jgi:ferrochelatase
MKDKTAILLINVGSPDKPEVGPVYRYLTQFLNDPQVIDLSWLSRKLLVNLIIIPFRVFKSTGLYRRLWTDQGFPLIIISRKLRDELNAADDTGYEVFLGMRYGNPGIKEAVSDIQRAGFRSVVIFPLYPQYAESTTGSAIEAAREELIRQNFRGEVVTIRQFYNHPRFISAFAERIRASQPETYDHILFSYHGLPERQVEKCHPGVKVRDCTCHLRFPAHGKNCYRAECYETTRLIAAELGLKEGSFSVSFQSRLSKNWLSPFTDETVILLATEGKKRVLVAAPSFVADCLETTVEIGKDYQKLFRQHGGEKLQLVDSLNNDPSWIKALLDILKDAQQD